MLPRPASWPIPWSQVMAAQPRWRLGDGGVPVHLQLLEAGWETGARQLPEHLFYLIEAGSLLLGVAQQEYRCRAGSLLVLPAGTRFCMRADPGAALPRIRRCRLQELDLPGTPLQLQADQVLQQAFGAMVAGITDTIVKSDRLLQGRLQTVLALIEQRLHQQPQSRLDQQRLEILRHMVATDPCHRWQVDDVAGALGLTADYATRCLRSALGMPPRLWLVQERLRHAAAMLVTTEGSVAEVAEQFGYVDGKLFGRQFKALYGDAPGRWRRRQQDLRYFA